MDKKYTSLENQIRNVVRGNLSESKNNKSLESKIRDVVLNEGSEKFAKIVSRTAAARGEPVTTDVDALEKKHAELQATAVAAAQHAAQTRKDYEDLARKYGITPEPIGEEVGLDEAPDSADPAGGGRLGVMDLFGHLRDHNEDLDRSSDPDDPDEEGAEESQFHIDSTEKAISKVHGEDTLNHMRQAIEAERHVRMGTNPGVNNHEAVRDHLDAAVKASRHFSENKQGYIITPKGRVAFGEGAKTIFKKIEQWAPPGWSAKIGKGTGTELAIPSPKTVTAPPKAPDISVQPPVAKTGTDVAIPGQQSIPKPNTKVDIPNATPVKPTVTPPKIATPEPTITAKPKNITEPVTKPGSVPKSGGRAGRTGKAEVAGEIANFLFGGSGGGAMPSSRTSAPSGGRIDLTRNRHYAKDRQVYGQEVHYNEYQPDGSYIGEDADAERSAIENVARPNSKNKLTKQAEIQSKIIEDTQRRKAVILRAKEENKNGKDGANGMVETKPELKRVNEITAAEIASGTGKVLGKTGKVLFGPLGTIASTAYDAKTAIDAGEDPERVALRTGLGASGAVAGGFGGGVLGTAVAPGPGTFVGGAAGAVGGSELGDYVGRKLYDTGLYGKGKDFVKGASGAVSGAADAVSDAADTVSDTASSAYNKLKGAFSSPTPAPTPAPKPTNTGSAMGTAAGRAITQSSKPGSAMGTAAGKAITKVAPKPAPKPALKLPGPGTPGYRTDAQMARAEADRARLLNANPNSVGARSAGNRSVEAATKSLNTNTPVVAPQPSPGINSTNTESPRPMGSSWNNSYKNKYSMGPGPSQFPSK